LPQELLLRLRTHIQTVAQYQAAWEQAVSDQDQFSRQRARFGMPWVLRIFFPLAAGLSTILSLGLAGTAMMLLIGPLQTLLGDDVGGISAGLVFMSVHAGLLLSMRRALVRRRKTSERWKPPPVGRERCPTCGGTVPVVTGSTMGCPFCGSTLVASASDARRIESAAHAVLLARQRAAEAERRKAEASGAESAETVLEMVTMGTLFPMLLGAPFALGQLVVRLLARGAHSAQVDVAGFVVGAALAVATVTVTIVVAVRRDRRRRNVERP
jgi:predicted RNA-binding Zn-ribbon protein involved in translation (DUF1610 family)